MKRGLNKFFSILLVVCMLLSMVPATAVFAATPGVVYLRPNSNWASDGARFAAYFFGTGEQWVNLVDTNSDGIYEASVPSGVTHVIFCRMNGGNNTNGWGNVWNQTTDLALMSDGSNYFIMNDGDWNGGGYWSTYSGDYYLFGYINGANYACEEDAANTGTFKFEGGKLTATFTHESYVGVKTGDNSRWYMTEGYQGAASSATLYNTNRLYSPDKLYVPAGIKVTFTLQENADGSLKLSYTVDEGSCKHLFFTDDVCNACGYYNECSHSYTSKVTTAATCTANGVKTYTCKSCGHSYTEVVKATGHKMSGTKCTVCGYNTACSHSYTSKVTTAATCTKAGVKTYTCSKCGNSYIENIPATGVHSYSNGKCTVCGAAEAGYNADYYLFGYINGANYACEGDADNKGIYKFTNGTLSAIFQTESYVGVKTGDNAAWYMTEGWQGDKTSVTLYNTEVNANPDKLYVPGGVQLTFTLTKNADGTLTLSYQAEQCDHSYSSKVTTKATCTASGVKTFTCSKCGHIYTESIAATGHSFSSGKCSVCGVSQSGAEQTSAYYLFGYINGANYGGEDDWENLGEYKFVNGKLTATFQQDSYVGVKTGDNAKWYMTNGWQGNVTSATLYSTDINANPDKLYVPGGREITFTLKVNADDTLTLSYVAKECSHSYSSKVTTAATCTENGVKTYTCSLCGHSYTETVKATGHKLSGDKCTVCGYNTACSHSYSSKVTTAATCISAGVKTFTCSKCGHSYTESIATTDHSYTNGKCSTCGKADPAQGKEYYLFGFIDGSNYACEENADNNGVYKFVNGKLTATFQTDSYVGVKTGDNSHWYMTEGWQGVDATSVTLYDTGMNPNPDKMYVPGGVVLTFTLKVNANDTLTLSYEAAKCDHSYTSKITTAATCTSNGVKTYTCTGCNTSYTEVIPATGHSYKSGKCTACGAADPSSSPVTKDYYLFGFINGGNYACEEDFENKGIYKFVNGQLTATFDTDSYVGVKSGDNADWYMTEGWQGVDATCVTLINTATNTNPDKMFVPGGVELNFTLTQNADGSLTLSYAMDKCDHSYTSKVTVEATSNTDGLRTYTCSKCGHSYTEVIPATDREGGSSACSHSYSSKVTTAATCTAVGVRTYTCSKCGNSYTESIAATGHSYVSGKCSTCGKAEGSGVRIHFVDATVWQNVCVYLWKDKSGKTTNLNSWPGDIVNRDADGYFTLDLDYTPVSGESLGMIFHNFNGAQTTDVVIDYATLKSGDVWVKPNTWTNGEGKNECYVTTQESSMYLSPEINGSSVTFRYQNSSAKSVALAGSFNNWSTTANKMTKGSDGWWTTTMTLADGVHEYRFVVGGSEWVLDPTNGLIGGYDGNSLVIVGGTGNTSSDTITIKFHFYRENGDYKNWDVWMWCNSNSGAGCTFTDDPLYKGKTATFTLSGKKDANVKYKVRKTDWSDEEFWERSIDLSNIASGTVHYFVNSGSFDGSIVYGNDVVKMAKPNYANIDYNSGNIWVKTPLPATGTLTSAFSVVKSDGSASDIKVTGVTMDNYGYSLQLSRKPKIHELYDLRVKYHTLIDVQTEGLFYSWGFAEDYTYYGNDLGATWSKGSTTFKVWAPTATGVSVLLYGGGNWGGDDWISTTEMTRGDRGVWTVTIKGDLNGKYYNFLVKFPTYSCEATDPYAKAVGVNGDRGMVIDLNSTDPEGWDEDVSPNKNMSYTDAIIYEMHLREMTIDASSGVKEEYRGKYLGMAQEGTTYEGRGTALQHLKELGITHVQIMPMYDFNAVDEYHLTDWAQYGWGYDPKNFNVPDGSYSTDPYHGEVRVNEVKQMVQAFHNNGINVVMDVVYNHAYSGGDFCYNKIVPNYFSRFWGENNWSNGSGVGNDMATERSMARNFIVDSVLYWVEEYHIDGFRFDLAGLIDSQTISEIVWEVHQKHPNVIFYGEGWTGGGSTAVQDGHTLASKENAWSVDGFAFYNDSFRNAIAGDDGRSTGFVSGDGGKADSIANYFRASNGWSTSPSQTINYVSCHDNYSLFDKLILSRNGAYWDQLVRMNNMSAAMVMLSQGIPFMYSGEELLREKIDQWGNRQHNCYNSEDSVTKIYWNDLVSKSMVQTVDDYYSGLINFRKNHGALRCADGGSAWDSTSYYKINDKCIMFYVRGGYNYECSSGIIIIFNANEYGQGVNIYDYGVPYGNWQACIHGMQAGVNPLWSTSDGNIIVDSISTTVLVLGDLIHEESVYNQQSYRCSCAYHNQSGLCWDCGKSVSHTFVNGYCSHCNLAQSASGNVTLYYNNEGTDWDNVYCYAWSTVGGLTHSYSGDWPGTKMTDMGNGTFSVSIPNAATHVIFTDNATGQSKEQGLIKNDNGVLTSNLHSSATGTWTNYNSSCKHSSHGQNGLCTSCGLGVSHSYANGACTVCGVEDPAVAANAYYLFGWINNANYGCESDEANLGIYKFVDGKLTATFTHDSYVGVKTGDNANFYMTNGWQGDKTSVTLYNTDVNANPDKLFVPGGVQITFTVKKNSDGTLKLSYTTAACQHVYEETVTVPATNTSEGLMTYTCTKCGDSYSEAIPIMGRFMTDPNCAHSYTTEVIEAATCIATGVNVYTCGGCGLSYCDTVPVTGHSYKSGVCTVCGIKEKSDVYYLFGYINGANYGCEEDWQNLGHYQFLGDGTCTATFDVDSYVAVKRVNSVTGEVLDWYMTNGWQGMDVTSVSLHDTDALGGNADKLYIPGGKRVVIRLTVNADGSLKLSYGDVNCSHTFDSGLVTRSAGCETEGVKTYSCTKCGHSYTETIPPVGHTCFNGKCCICGVDDINYLSGCCEKYNHIYCLVSETPATCTQDGSRYYEADCGAGYAELVSSPGHSYNSRVETAATCVLPGLKSFTCACGYSYTDAIEALGHQFRNGVCAVCGEAESGVSGAHTYYLFGNINGVDYGNGEDWENLGEYKFVGGQLTATFEQDSYIGIKTGDNMNWYMTQSFTADTSATFYDTVTGVYEKMFVPGGVQVTFTLVENADGTLSLSYTTADVGGSVILPNITLKYPSMSFKDEVKLNVYFDATDLDSVVDMGLIVFSSKVGSYTVYNAEDLISGYQYSSSAKLYCVSTNGIPAKNMGDTIWFAVYAQLSNGTYTYSKLVDYSPRTYAYTMLGSGDAKLDALLVAMLNYGTAAQTYFGYNTGSLLNNQLTSDQMALVSAYSSTMMPDIAAPSASKQGSFVSNGGFEDKYPSVTFGGAFAINYYCVPSYVPASSVTMYYWREADYNAASVLTAENATGSLKMSGGGTYRGSVTGISAKDISDGVYVAFVYSDGTTTYSSGVLPYSIGMYCKTMASYENSFTPFAQATAVYGYYAKQYFG